jgi:hypothetical protein
MYVNRLTISNIKKFIRINKFKKIIYVSPNIVNIIDFLIMFI